MKWASKKTSPLLIRAVVKVDSAIGAVAQAVRPRIGPAGAMVTFEDAFVPPEINRWLGGFLGAEPAGLGLQRLVFRASRSLAGAQIGCVSIASVASGGGSGGGVILT